MEARSAFTHNHTFLFIFFRSFIYINLSSHEQTDQAEVNNEVTWKFGKNQSAMIFYDAYIALQAKIS